MAIETNGQISVFVLAHQQPNQLALALLAMRGVTFAMGSGQTLTRSDSNGIAWLGQFEIGSHDRCNQST